MISAAVPLEQPAAVAYAAPDRTNGAFPVESAVAMARSKSPAASKEGSAVAFRAGGSGGLYATESGGWLPAAFLRTIFAKGATG